MYKLEMWLYYQLDSVISTSRLYAVQRGLNLEVASEKFDIVKPLIKSTKGGGSK